MQTVITPNTGFSDSLAWVSATEFEFTVPSVITPNTTPSSATVMTLVSGTNIVSVSQQPTSLSVGNVLYTQVQANPVAGQYSYNPNTQQVTIVVPTNQNNNQAIIESAALIVMHSIFPSESIFSENSTPLFDRVTIDEIGSDFYYWLVNLGAGHSGELLLNYSHNKGDFPTLSIDIEVTKSQSTATLAAIESSLNNRQIHTVYKTPFYLKPPSITIYDNSNIVSIPLIFESVYAPREDYNPLDRYINIVQDQQLSFAGLLSNQGMALRSDTSSTIKSRNDDKRERRKIRDLLDANAKANASYIDYSGNTISLTRNNLTAVHKLPDNFSILPEYTITRNGLIGAPIVDGVRLSKPWIFKGWLPDDSNLLVKDDNSQEPYENLESLVEIKLMGDPDLQPNFPTKILDGVNYQYISTEESDKFPILAQNPSAVAYPNGFKKSAWQQKNEYGFNAGQINGEEWGWQIVSTDVWSFFDPTGDYSEDPIWIYTPPVASAFWKKCRSWSLIVGFDVLGYPVVEQEIGIRYIQPKTESDDKTAVTLLYEAAKLDYEANQLVAAGNITEAVQKQKLATSKRTDANLYKFREFPYIRTTKRFYRKLSLDRPEIKDPQRQDPCNKEEREAEDPATDPAYFLEREIVEEKSLITIPSPYAGEAAIAVGEDYESRTWVIVSPGGYQTFESVRSSVQESGNTANLTASEWRTGTPEPAPKKPKATRKLATPKPDKKEQEQFINYLATPGGDAVFYQNASRSTISLEGVRNFGMALPALLEICREENLNSEQTVTDSPWYRIIKPGEKAFWMGKSWQCTSINRTDKLHPGGLIQCQSYRCDWGSYLPSLTLSVQSISTCAI